MRTVAVTGGIGSGKTAVCSILSAKGIPVYDCDSAAKRLYGEDSSLLDRIEESFGCGFRLPDGGTDTEKLASVVFPDPSKLAALEAIVHPAVLEDFLRWRTVMEARVAGSVGTDAFFGKRPFCVLESAIILEKPAFLRLADAVVLVDAPLAKRLERACGRDAVPAEKIIRRMSAQRLDVSKADAVLSNGGSLDELPAEVERVFGSLEL